MAQLPWSVVTARPVTFGKARLAAEKCSQGIAQQIDNKPLKMRLTSMLQAFAEAMQECENSEELRNVTSHVPGMSMVKAKGVVQIHPSFLGNALKGVYTYLSNFLMQYNEELGGIWLTCGKIRQQDECGYVTDGDCFGVLSLSVTLKMVVFYPFSRSVIGKVARVSAHRASLLVYGIFGVTVRSVDEASEEHHELTEGSLVDVEVDDVKILPKNKWVMLATAVERVKLIT
ncbi:hypothetical protein, conserved [Babesia bigemina]|uniref:RNA polymerase Rpb7-like N-terminal domain-containing protein n=1 Tax=Babesia bigemina TaxID=5866 RepID=A0A061DEQ6_BABBI|nr:hypothetical protein, conserved [Babesia bigemina]CDR97695.1 hypothetical protein, conserved [Babesia bigemina]|eukprot:XP_012769881.1 hypothetical protein, conserved [Babesia bigemina]